MIDHSAVPSTPPKSWSISEARPELLRRYFTFWLLCFLCHQMAIGLFRLMGAIGRSLVVAYTIAWLLFLLLILLSGFVLSKREWAVH